MKIFTSLIIFWSLLLSMDCTSQDYSPTYLTRSEAAQDIEFLYDKLTKIHPELLDTNNIRKWEVLYDTIHEKVADSISFNSFYTLIAPVLSNLRDGHSNFLFPVSERKKYMLNGGLSLPLTVKIHSGSIYVNQYFGESTQKEIQGMEILSINDIPSEKILNDMAAFHGSKKKSVGSLNMERYFNAYYWILYGHCISYDLLLKDSVQIISSLVETGVSNTRYLELRNKCFPDNKKENYLLNFYNENNIAYIRIKSFADLNGITAFLSLAFDSISKMSPENLIIDIRDNSGGRSICVDTLMNYLTDKKYALYKSVHLRISKDIKDYYKNKYPERYDAIKFVKIDSLMPYNDSDRIKKPLSSAYRFDGELFILINDRTYSGAATFAGAIKELKIGKIAGQETGGTIQYYGDFLMFQLPNTGMGFFLSPKSFVQYGGSNPEMGVIPDVLLKDSSNMLVELLSKIENNSYSD